MVDTETLIDTSLKVGDKVTHKGRHRVIVAECESPKLMWLGKSQLANGGPYTCAFVGDLKPA